MQGLVYCNVDPVCGNSGLQFFYVGHDKERSITLCRSVCILVSSISGQNHRDV